MLSKYGVGFAVRVSDERLKLIVIQYGIRKDPDQGNEGELG